MHQRNHASSQFIISIAIAVFFVGGSLAHEKTDWKARLFAEAPKRWEEYLRFARSLQVIAVANVYEGSNRSPIRSVRTEYKQAAGASLRVVDRKGTPLRAIDRNRGPMNEAEAECTNPSYSFKSKRRVPDSGWIITDLELPGQSNAFGDEQRELQERHLRGVCDCLILENLWLPTLIQDPDFKITAIKNQEIDGLPVVRFDFEYPKPDKDYPVPGAVPLKGGWMVLDPEHDWILREYMVHPGQPETNYMRQTFQIREGSDRHPIVVHHTHQRVGKGKKPFQRLLSPAW